MARFPFTYIIILWKPKNRKVLEMLKTLFNIVILIIALYISYRLIKSGNYSLKEANKIRRQVKERRKRDNGKN